MSSVIEKSEKRPVIVQPFSIEVDHPRNCDVLLQSIPGQRLRSSISAGKPTTNVKTGAKVIPPDQSAFLGQFPTIPGMQLHVDPANLTYTIIDPLADDEDLCDRIKRGLDRSGAFRTEGKLRGVPPQRGELDVHRMKTLVREMMWLIGGKEAHVIKGAAPEMSDVEKLPGNFMLNPGSRVPNTQPTFEKDFDAWLERLVAAGG